MLETIIRGIRCVFRNKMRAFLTVLGIAVGVMSVVLVSSVGELGKTAIDGEMSGMGMDNLVISSAKLDENDLNAVRATENVRDAMPLMNLITQLKLKGESGGVMLWGVNEDADKVIDLDLTCGRLIGKGDVAAEKHVCVIDEAIAYDFYSRGNIIGKTAYITIGGNEIGFEIIGVVKNGVNTLQSMLGGFIPDFVYVPYSVMQEYTSTAAFDNITVKIADGADSETAAAVIKNTLEISKPDESVSVENLMRQKDKMNNIMNIISAALAVIAGISLIVSGISIMTVMLVSVNERTREIGIKKSIGATTACIMSEFLLEAAIITFTGGLTGLAAGSGILTIAGWLLGIKIPINSAVIISVLIISGLIGIVFGVYPARKAALLKPVDALRHE